MAENDVQIALLTQRIEQMASEVKTIKTELDGLKSKSLMVTGGLMLLMALGSAVGWLVSIAERVRFK